MRQTRRRGEELEQHIFRTAIRILNEEGYQNVTFANIAAQAETGRAVLYRRWHNVFELLQDAFQSLPMEKKGKKLLHQKIDTGNLRDDIHQLLAIYLTVTQGYGKEFIRAYLFETTRNSERMERHLAYIREENIKVVDALLERARQRGEMQGEVSEYVKLVPFDLLRQEVMFNESVPASFVTKLTDEVVMPVLLHHTTQEMK